MRLCRDCTICVKKICEIFSVINVTTNLYLLVYSYVIVYKPLQHHALSSFTRGLFLHVRMHRNRLAAGLCVSPEFEGGLKRKGGEGEEKRERKRMDTPIV